MAMNKELNRLASKLAAMEGKKSEVSIGNIKKILSLLCALGTAYSLANMETNDHPIVVIATEISNRIEKYKAKRKKK